MDKKLRKKLCDFLQCDCGETHCASIDYLEQAFRDAGWTESQQPVEGELVGTTGTSYPTICDKCERGTYYWIAHGDEKWCLECHHKDYQEQNQQTIVTIPESNFGKHGGTCCLGCHEAQLAYDKVRMKVHPSEGELAPCPFLIGGTRICEKPKFGRHETCITSNCAVIEGIKAQLAHDKQRIKEAQENAEEWEAKWEESEAELDKYRAATMAKLSSEDELALGLCDHPNYTSRELAYELLRLLGGKK